MGEPAEKRLAAAAAATPMVKPAAVAPSKKAAAGPIPEKQPGAPDQLDPEDDVEMSFFDHLRDLRKRFIYALYGIVPGVGLAAYFAGDILTFLTAPFLDAYRNTDLGEPSLHIASPADGFVAQISIALVCGAIFASPWIFYQAWAFVSPGLYRRERRLALPFVIFAGLFFIAGAFFGYQFVLPPAFQALLAFTGTIDSSLVEAELTVTPTIMVLDYLDFALRMLLALGITFEVPIVIGFLAWIHVVNWRQLLGFSRWWVVISAVLSAVLTPSGDAGTMMLVLAPLVVLYYVAIAIAFVVGPRPPKDPPPAKGDTPPPKVAA